MTALSLRQTPTAPPPPRRRPTEKVTKPTITMPRRQKKMNRETECPVLVAEKGDVGNAAAPDGFVEVPSCGNEIHQPHPTEISPPPSSYLRKFGLHCQSFYNSSLILSSFESSLDSVNEEKKVEDGAVTANNNLSTKNVDRGRVVVETFDRISAIRATVSNDITPSKSLEQQQKYRAIAESSIAKLRQEHVLCTEQHHDLLQECGLLNIDTFITYCSSHEHSEQSDAATSTRCDKPSTQLFQEYTQMRDAMRRRSHKLAMMQRQSSLFELLSQSQSEQDGQNDIAAIEDVQETITHPLTRIQNVQSTIDNLQKFVRKYQSNVGSHSFLAGLHCMIETQLNPKDGNVRNTDSSYIVRWMFRGSALTEACHSQDDQDTLAYASDASKVLFSILVWIREIDIEGAGASFSTRASSVGFEDQYSVDWESVLHQHSTDDDSTEALLSFEINKFISNASLRRILAVLPNPKMLDARPTGSVEVFIVSSGEVQTRKNADGQLDEAWPWFASLQLCTVL
jgi:hypothetical protein